MKDGRIYEEIWDDGDLVTKRIIKEADTEKLGNYKHIVKINKRNNLDNNKKEKKNKRDNGQGQVQSERKKKKNYETKYCIL